MIPILQINMHRSATAHEFQAQFAAETKADFVVISEQYRNWDPASWHPDISDTAAIWVRGGTRFKVLAQGLGDGFVWIWCSGVRFFSVYLTPNETMPDFRRKLVALEDAILGIEGRIRVVGDFNVRAFEWGMSHSDSREKRILEMAREQTTNRGKGKPPAIKSNTKTAKQRNVSYAKRRLAKPSLN